MRVKLAAFSTLALLVASCSPPAETVTAPADATSSISTTATLTASGEATPLTAEEMTDSMQWVASVVRVDDVQTTAGAKLFGTAGGDPAMNGLYTYIAFYRGPAEGWSVFSVGDVLDYRILSASPGRIELEINESTLDEASGNIGSRTRNAILTWTPGADGEPPQSVSITPAS